MGWINNLFGTKESSKHPLTTPIGKPFAPCSCGERLNALGVCEKCALHEIAEEGILVTAAENPSGGFSFNRGPRRLDFTPSGGGASGNSSSCGHLRQAGRHTRAAQKLASKPPASDYQSVLDKIKLHQEAENAHLAANKACKAKSADSLKLHNEAWNATSAANNRQLTLSADYLNDVGLSNEERANKHAFTANAMQGLLRDRDASLVDEDINTIIAARNAHKEAYEAFKEPNDFLVAEKRDEHPDTSWAETIPDDREWFAQRAYSLTRKVVARLRR